MIMNRYGGAKPMRAINFICNAPQAQAVSLVVHAKPVTTLSAKNKLTGGA